MSTFCEHGCYWDCEHAVAPSPESSNAMEAREETIAFVREHGFFTRNSRDELDQVPAWALQATAEGIMDGSALRPVR